MAETVAKQLRFSPVASTPLEQQQFHLHTVQRRLDARPDWGDGSSNPTGMNQSSRGIVFKVPTDDEDEEQHHANSMSPAQNHNDISNLYPMGPNDTRQHQQQQQQLMFVFSDVPSGQQGPVEAVLWEHTRTLQAHALREADSKQQQLHSQLHEVEAVLSQQLQEVQQQAAHKRARAAAEDEALARQRMQERHLKMQELQQQQMALQAAHASALQEMQKQRELEAQRRVEAAAAAAAAAAASAEAQRWQEEERKKQQEAAAAAAAAARAQAQPAAAGATQQQQQSAAPPAATAAAAAGSIVPLLGGSSSSAANSRASAGALEYEARLKAGLDAAEASTRALISQPEMKAARRSVEKKITMWVSQISGTQQQVREKALQLIELIQSCSAPDQQALACVTLANRMLSQCEVQVARIGSFAFPLAYVCVAVGAAVPQFMDILMAKLQQACPLLVPKHTKRSPGASNTKYFQGLGYRLVDDPRKPDAKRLETADEFVARVMAMVLLYASIVQTESAGNPLPMSHGWTWMARCLNSMPPNRSCAAALMAFLSHAGYRMAAVYGRQFQKMLQHLADHFVPALEAKAEQDTNLRAIAMRLHNYISSRVYLKEPEGRTLKKVDESQSTHA